MNPILNMMLLTPEAIGDDINGITVRNDQANLYTVKAVHDDEYEIIVYVVTRVADGAYKPTQIFDNVIKYVAGVKPF